VSRFVLFEMRPSVGYRSSQLFQLNRRFTGQVRAVCEQAMQSGEFRADVSPALLRDMIFGCIEHQTWAFLHGEGDFQVEALADAITNVIYRGMVVEPQQPTAALGAVIERLEKAASSIERGLAGR
jgi:hypothetical protein